MYLAFAIHSVYPDMTTKLLLAVDVLPALGLYGTTVHQATVLHYWRLVTFALSTPYKYSYLLTYLLL